MISEKAGERRAQEILLPSAAHPETNILRPAASACTQRGKIASSADGDPEHRHVKKARLAARITLRVRHLTTIWPKYIGWLVEAALFSCETGRATAGRCRNQLFLPPRALYMEKHLLPRFLTGTKIKWDRECAAEEKH